MRTEPKFMLFAGFFGLVVAVVYWFLSYERAGSTLLLFVFFAPTLVGGYLVHRAWGLTRLEDRDDATPADAGGHAVGRFPMGSVWPLWMALGAAIAGLGFVFGAWPLMLGLVLLAAAAVGLIQETRGWERPRQRTRSPPPGPSR